LNTRAGSFGEDGKAVGKAAFIGGRAREKCMLFKKNNIVLTKELNKKGAEN